MKFAKRVLAIQPSATLAAAQKKRDLEQTGVKVLDFTVGEPDFPTPTVIKEAAKKALDANDTYYQPVPGTPALRKAICEKLKKENGLEYTPEEILVSCGAKNVILQAILALVEEGDEVLIPSPYWVSFPEQVTLAGGKPVFIETDDLSNFKITAEALKKPISKKTRLLILNTPSNPTGMAYTRKEQEALGKICEGHDFLILSDEMYEKLVFDSFQHVSFAAACPQLKSRTITVNGASKAYAMTGWRMGYGAAPKELIEKMKTLQSQGITCIPGFIQQACITALKETEGDIQKMVKAFHERRNVLVRGLNEIAGVRCLQPNGTFFCFPNMKEAMKKKGIKTTLELSEHFLEKLHIATVAGEGFGAPGYLRFSYATNLESIKEGLKRLKGFFG